MIQPVAMTPEDHVVMDLQPQFHVTVPEDVRDTVTRSLAGTRLRILLLSDLHSRHRPVPARGRGRRGREGAGLGLSQEGAADRESWHGLRELRNEG